MRTVNSYATGKRRLKVLLVQSNNHGQESETCRQLTAAGHAVTVATGGSEAARILRNRLANLVLVEQTSNAGTLLDLVANLRSESGRLSARYTPIFVLAEESSLTSVSEAYVDGLLQLPFDCEELMAAYLSFLSDSLSGVRRGSQAGPRCDIDAAIDRLGGDVELYKDLVSRFLDDTAGTRRQLESALERGESELLHRSAHCLKGLAASVGATAAAGALADLEELGRVDDFSRVACVWQRFQSEMERTADELAAYHRPPRIAPAPPQ